MGYKIAQSILANRGDYVNYLCFYGFYGCDNYHRTYVRLIMEIMNFTGDNIAMKGEREYEIVTEAHHTPPTSKASRKRGLGFMATLPNLLKAG